MNRLSAPNFFILGAGKCGTTSLHHVLRQHPQIHLTDPKESSFFSPGFQLISNPVEYFNLFPTQDGKLRYGEASHLYFSAPETPPILRQLFPEAKFILILRDPVERAYSLYCHLHRVALEPLETFEQALAAEELRFADPSFRINCPQYFWNYMYFRSSLYDQQFARYREIFPLEQFFVLTLGEWQSDTKHWAREIFRFLEIEPEVDVNTDLQNEGGHDEPMRLSTRRWLSSRFAGVREGIEQRIGRRLDRWEKEANRETDMARSSEPSLKFAVDQLLCEDDAGSEWSLLGWAFLPHAKLFSAHLELEGKTLCPLSYGFPRKDVLDAYPSTCVSENVGFIAHVLLPHGLAAGFHTVNAIFSDQDGRESGRFPIDINTSEKVERGPSLFPAPAMSLGIPESARLYLDLFEKTLLALPYTTGDEGREEGRDWPKFAHTMIGAKRLRNLRECAETALRDGVPGDFIETGVWRGGACILLRAVLKAYGVTDRTVWVADSFMGLPRPDAEKYPADVGDALYTYPQLAISLEEVQKNFDAYDLLDRQVKFLKGFFAETLTLAPVEKLAVLRLDGDMYGSTMDALIALYPKLSLGGFCIIDDYGAIAACRQAVRDYRKANGIDEPITVVDWTGAWWRKAKE